MAGAESSCSKVSTLLLDSVVALKEAAAALASLSLLFLAGAEAGFVSSFFSVCGCGFLLAAAPEFLLPRPFAFFSESSLFPPQLDFEELEELP